MVPQDLMSLERFEQHAWMRLEQAVGDPTSAFHTPVVATISTDGTPAMRTVVLRAVDPATRTVRFHTDLRSAKIAQLRATPRVAMLGYDAQAKLQLRLTGVAHVHADDRVAADAWATSRATSLICYRQDPGPGTPLLDPTLTDSSRSGGYENFATVVVTIETTEVLYLHRTGHHRALFIGNGCTAQRTWLAP